MESNFIERKIILSILLCIIWYSLFSQWELIAPHNTNPEYHGFTFYNVYFLNEDTGFVVGDSSYFDGGVILRTHNGGQSWDTTFTSGVICSVQFLNDSVGFAGSDQRYFYKTVNGGDTWDEIYVYQQSIQLQLNNSIYFKNELEGYLATSYTFHNPNYIVKTIDGGMSWQAVFFPDSTHPGGYLNFPSGNIGYAGILFKTFNAGADWCVWLDSIVTQLPGNFRNPFGIDFYNDTVGLAAGYYFAGQPYNNNRGMIGVTKDGGYNYDFFEINNWYRVWDIVMVDLKNAYAVGELCPQDTSNPQFLSVFLASKDGGNTWGYQEHELDSLYPYPRMHALCFPTPTTGYAVSYFGQIYKTTNAGGDPIPMLSVEKPMDDETDELLLHPNPASHYLYLNMSNLNTDSFVLNIYNMNGMLVQKSDMYVNNGQYSKINISHLPDGIYLLKIEAENIDRVFKFIKN